MSRIARLLLVVGTVAAVIGLGRIHAMRNTYDLTESARFSWSVAYVALLLISAYAVGLPDLPQTRRSAVAVSVTATLLAAIGISVVQLAVGDALLPRFVVFGSAIVLLPIYVGTAFLASRGRLRAENRDRILLVCGASSEEGQLLQAELEIDSEKPAFLVGSLSVEEALPSPDRSHPLMDWVQEQGVTVLVLDRVAGAQETVVTQAATLHEEGIRIRTLSLFYEEWLGKLPIGELERSSLFFDIGWLHRERYARVKRVTDLSLGLVGLLAFLITMPVVALGNIIANRGPLFYVQTRVGQGGSSFPILKFRTMHPDRGYLVNEWTTEDDPRITPFGRVLRRSHIDELPQVLNILRGHLSVVGPRPEQPHYVAELGSRLPFYNLRHTVRPGLTGWAQVKYGYAGNESDAIQKLQYEFFYLRHQGFWFDLRIIARTFRSILRQGGR